MAAAVTFFIGEDLQPGGGAQRSLDGYDDLPLIERLCCQHVDLVLNRVGYYFQALPYVNGVLIHLLADPVPDAHTYSAGRGKTGYVRITTGLLSLIAVLAARAAIIIEDSQQYRGWLSPLADRMPPDLEKAFEFPGFGEFSVDERKISAGGLDADGLAALSERLRGSSRLTINTLELAAAAAEFAVLHEIGHFDAGHHEARRLQKTAGTTDSELPSSFRPDVKVQRLFEHQADTFALRLMIACCNLRPLLKIDHFDLQPDAKDRLGRNFVAYIGAAINMSIVALLRAPAPAPNQDIDLLDRTRSEHPLPSTRLRMVNLTLGEELSDSKIQRHLWPGFGEVAGIPADPETVVKGYLEAFSFQAMMLGMTTISGHWPSAINTASNERRPTTLKYAFGEEKHWDIMADEQSAESVDIAKSLTEMTTKESRELLDHLRKPLT